RVPAPRNGDPASARSLSPLRGAPNTASWSALMPRSALGGRHELGQNFLVHTPTINRITRLVARTEGAILEIGAGDGALTRSLATLDRPLTAIDIDEHRVQWLRRALPRVDVQHADA